MAGVRTGRIFRKTRRSRHLSAEVNNARFAPPDGKGDDLRCGIHVATGSIRSVFIHGYDLASAANWKRLLLTKKFDSDRPRMLWTPGETATVKLHLSNLAKVPYAGPCTVVFSDDMEKPIWTRTASLDVPAQGESATSMQVETKGLRHGVYLLKWTTPDGAVAARALLTVADIEPLPKARDGEFLYGVDLAAPYTDNLRLDWVDWCGIDIVRNFGQDVVPNIRMTWTISLKPSPSRGNAVCAARSCCSR